MKIFKLTYGMDSYFTNRYGDLYLCKSIESLEKKLFQELDQELKDLEIEKKDYLAIKEEFKKWRKRRQKYYGNEILQISEGETHIMIEEVELI